MPWDQSNNSQKDPWNKQGGQVPPDLTELFKRFSGSFKKSGNGSGGGNVSPANYSIIVVAVLVVWLLSGIYIVNEGQRGVVLQFGAYSETSLPGPHWHIPYPIESVEKVDVDRIRSTQNQSRMLTQDENIVEVELAVQYRVKDAADYLFNIRTPDISEDSADQTRGTLFQVMESTIREVVGGSKMDFILGEGRAEIAAEIKSGMTTVLDEYQSGMEIVTVNLQQSQPPEAVQGAFADAIKAREDEVRFVNEAETYSNGIIPQARGEASRITQSATAYRERVVNNSEGEAQRFLDINQEYKKAPVVTRKRMYIQAIESVFSKSNKIIVDVAKGSSNVFYLPLDRITRDANNSSTSGGNDMSSDDSGQTTNSDTGSDASGALSRANDRMRRGSGSSRQFMQGRNK